MRSPAGGSAGSHVRRNRQVIRYTIPHNKMLPALKGVPIVVLTSQTTHSAGELFAIVMQAHRRATVIGMPSAGNVEMVQDFRLPDGSLLWLAVGHYFAPDGRPMENLGVRPDVVIAANWWRYSLSDDPHIQRAARVLQSLR